MFVQRQVQQHHSVINMVNVSILVTNGNGHNHTEEHKVC